MPQDAGILLRVSALAVPDRPRCRALLALFATAHAEKALCNLFSAASFFSFDEGQRGQPWQLWPAIAPPTTARLAAWPTEVLAEAVVQLLAGCGEPDGRRAVVLRR